MADMMLLPSEGVGFDSCISYFLLIADYFRGSILTQSSWFLFEHECTVHLELSQKK